MPTPFGSDERVKAHELGGLQDTTMPRYKYSLVACSRWEEHDIVEWIEYHHSIGFDHFYIYSNDDSPNTQYRVLQPYIFGADPLVTYLFWPRLGEQTEMYANFLGNFKDETEWACFLDIDEFLVFKNMNSISSFMWGFEPLTDCIYLNWLNYGNSGKKIRDKDSILSTLTRRSRRLDVHTKTIFRTGCVTESLAREGAALTGLPFTHFWNGYPLGEFRMCDVLGRDVSSYADDFPASALQFLSYPGVVEQILSIAYVAHFMIKSEEDFVRRAARGGFSEQTIWRDRYERNEHVSILAGLNEIKDEYLKNYWDRYTSQSIRYPAGDMERPVSLAPLPQFVNGGDSTPANEQEASNGEI